MAAYLDFATYSNLGGTLSEAAFEALEKRAEYLINSQAAGQTGKRIARLSAVPACVTDCVAELISYMDTNGTPATTKGIASASQSSDGVSESYSYIAKTTDEQNTEMSDIIYTYLYGGGYGNLLYRGLNID